MPVPVHFEGLLQKLLSCCHPNYIEALRRCWDGEVAGLHECEQKSRYPQRKNIICRLGQLSIRVGHARRRQHVRQSHERAPLFCQQYRHCYYHLVSIHLDKWSQIHHPYKEVLRPLLH